MIKITKENVKELWALYEDYMEDFKQKYYSNIKPMPFEYMVENHMVYCNECHKYVLDNQYFEENQKCLKCVMEEEK